jgi:hypothetical protein
MTGTDALSLMEKGPKQQSDGDGSARVGLPAFTGSPAEH